MFTGYLVFRQPVLKIGNISVLQATSRNPRALEINKFSP